MIFSLEALQALHGDCLILHYGDTDAPNFILIDGGPTKKNFRGLVEKRLDAIRDHWFEDEELPLQLVMVSHIDADHIQGILALTGDMLKRINNDDDEKFSITALWHNSFDDLTNNDEEELASEVAGTIDTASVETASLVGVPDADTFTKLVVASVPQGRQLRKDAKELGLAINLGFVPLDRAADRPGVVMTGADGTLPVLDNFGGGLELTVVGPDRQRVEKLQDHWDKEIKRLKREGKLNAASLAQLAAADPDSSPPNLSSIVVLAELGGKKMLLTGDALDTHILDTLEKSGHLAPDGELPLDLLKLPHHGSNRNVSEEFFRRLPAKHYVISADGKHDNPDLTTLTDMLEPGTLGRDDFTVHFTNKKGSHDLEAKLTAYEAGLADRGRDFKLRFRSEDNPSMIIDLLDKVEY